MNNHETYVSLKVAKLLKQAGFDWKVRYMYRNNNPTLCICTESPYRNIPKSSKCPMYWQYAAPTLEVAQRWLREVKELFLGVEPIAIEYEIKYQFGIWCYEGFVEGSSNFDTYESAQEAGIKKCLTLLLKEE